MRKTDMLKRMLKEDKVQYKLSNDFETSVSINKAHIYASLRFSRSL